MVDNDCASKVRSSVWFCRRRHDNEKNILNGRGTGVLEASDECGVWRLLQSRVHERMRRLLDGLLHGANW